MQVLHSAAGFLKGLMERYDSKDCERDSAARSAIGMGVQKFTAMVARKITQSQPAMAALLTGVLVGMIAPVSADAILTTGAAAAADKKPAPAGHHAAPAGRKNRTKQQKTPQAAGPPTTAETAAAAAAAAAFMAAQLIAEEEAAAAAASDKAAKQKAKQLAHKSAKKAAAAAAVNKCRKDAGAALTIEPTTGHQKLSACDTMMLAAGKYHHKPLESTAAAIEPCQDLSGFLSLAAYPSSAVSSSSTKGYSSSSSREGKHSEAATTTGGYLGHSSKSRRSILELQSIKSFANQNQLRMQELSIRIREQAGDPLAALEEAEAATAGVCSATAVAYAAEKAAPQHACQSQQSHPKKLSIATQLQEALQSEPPAGAAAVAGTIATHHAPFKDPAGILPFQTFLPTVEAGAAAAASSHTCSPSPSTAVAVAGTPAAPAAAPSAADITQLPSWSWLSHIMGQHPAVDVVGCAAVSGCNGSSSSSHQSLISAITSSSSSSGGLKAQSQHQAAVGSTVAAPALEGRRTDDAPYGDQHAALGWSTSAGGGVGCSQSSMIMLPAKERMSDVPKAAAAVATGGSNGMQRSPFPHDQYNGSGDHSQQVIHGREGVGGKKAVRKGRKRDCCVVCWESSSCVVLLPCKHMVLCEECSATLESKGADCPMCRATVKEHVVVFA